MSQNFGDEQSAAHCNVPSVHRTASLDASRHSPPSAVSIASDSENEETIESLGESFATGPWRSILFLPETAESATCSELAWGRGEAPGDQKREIDCSRCEIVAHLLRDRVELHVQLWGPPLFTSSDSVHDARKFLDHPLSIPSDSRLVLFLPLHRPFSIWPGRTSIPNLDAKSNRRMRMLTVGTKARTATTVCHGSRHRARGFQRLTIPRSSGPAKDEPHEGVFDHNERGGTVVPRDPPCDELRDSPGFRLHINALILGGGNEGGRTDDGDSAAWEAILGETEIWCVTPISWPGCRAEQARNELDQQSTSLNIAFVARFLIRMSTLIPEALTLSHVGKDVEQVAQLLTTETFKPQPVAAHSDSSDPPPDEDLPLPPPPFEKKIARRRESTRAIRESSPDSPSAPKRLNTGGSTVKSSMPPSRGPDPLLASPATDAGSASASSGSGGPRHIDFLNFSISRLPKPSAPTPMSSPRPSRPSRISVSRLELKPWWRSFGMTDEDRAVAVSWTIE
ncbi:hypothetical protein EHS25_007343 [Saitozyma podzolica]|uniref:Uncharacterized protein n=1 Tax=Saitozyma podzolica TaxID=1890683 RepID=A0A427XMV0_9TREE|nr:hypothetical protein EHS25_007343 [Saitozyma podzolica]